VEVTYGADPNAQTVTMAAYEYDGMNRRIRKEVTNFGTLDTPRLASRGLRKTKCGLSPQRRVKGNRHEHYYYGGGMGVSPVNWRVIEERDNASPSNRVLAQTVYSTEYIDAPVCRDRNTDVDSDDITNFLGQ